MRFPGFSDEWKTAKLGNLTIKVGSGVTPRGGESVYTDKGHPFVRSQNVGWGTLILDDIAYIDEDTHQKQKSTELKNGDVLLNITGASIGRSSIVDNRILNGNVNQHVCIIRLNEKAVPNYICNYLLSRYGQKQIDSFQCGGNRQGLNFEQIKSMIVKLPHIEEQKQITKLLIAIDKRISTQNKIIDNLQSLIKGLAKVLTIQGEPNTRISDCLECHTSALQESNLQDSGKYPVYGASGVAGHLDEYVCDKDSILIIKDGSGVGTVSHVSGKYSVIGTLNYLTAKSGYFLEYLYFCLMSFNFDPFKTGMAIPHIYFKDYGRAKIWCPSLESQNDIAKILSAIKEKLQIESGILDSLHRKKSYLLNNMFI